MTHPQFKMISACPRSDGMGQRSQEDSSRGLGARPAKGGPQMHGSVLGGILDGGACDHKMDMKTWGKSSALEIGWEFLGSDAISKEIGRCPT